MQTAETLFEFPCAFPLKIMGRAEEALIDAVLNIVAHHAPDFDPATLERRASAQGRYWGLTCTITATSREQLDALYLELTAHPLVKVVL